MSVVCGTEHTRAGDRGETKARKYAGATRRQRREALAPRRASVFFHLGIARIPRCNTRAPPFWG